ncbi:hypothetical protein BJ912DRAFT_975658 [Pholiota molesta]|nr:hypothetical protein BJ912DRAFT_975658 [Pholiota molesta]
MIDNNFIQLRRLRFDNTLAQRELDILGRDGNSPTPVIHFIVAFDILHVLGLVFLGAILLTVGRSFHIKRASTWFMFILSWFLTSLSNLMILGQQTGSAPREGVCLIQAMLIYGMPVFSSLYAVAFLLQLYLFVRNTVNENSIAVTRRQIVMIHALPFTAFTVTLIEVLTLGLLHPEAIQRHPSGMFCHLSNQIPSQITAAFTILAMITFLSLGILIFLKLRLKWTAVYAISSTAKTYPQISPDVATRVLIFSFCPIIALALSSIQYLPQHSADATKAKLNIVLAVLPLVAGLIFGSQRDILRVWMNCIQRKDSNTHV